MKKIFVFVFDGMTDYEITFVTHLLNTSGNKEIITVAYEKKQVKGRSGMVIIPDVILSQVKAEAAEGLIIPGGWYGDFTTELLDIIRDFHKQGKLLAGICGAGTVALARAGVLEKAEYTTPVEKWTRQHEKIFGGNDPFPRTTFLKKKVVRDKNIITAVGPGFINFAVEVCDWFNLFESKEEKETFIKEFTER